jgi:hypothetical protein
MIEHAVPLRPFTIPTYVVADIQGDSPAATTFHVREIARPTLEAMCAQFRRDVLRKAGHDPDAPTDRV